MPLSTTGTHDFIIRDHGSIVLLLPLTEEAQKWVAEHFDADSCITWSKSVVIEPRYLGPILDGIINDGLTF